MMKEKSMLRYFTILTALIMAMAIVACEPDTTSEKAADHIEDAGDELQAAADDVGNEVEDACEEIKEEAGAKDTDC